INGGSFGHDSADQVVGDEMHEHFAAEQRRAQTTEHLHLHGGFDVPEEQLDRPAPEVELGQFGGGVMWFYELQRQGHNYASGTVTFSGQPEFALGKKTQVFLGGPTPIEHIHLIGDTAESIATCFALLINAGSTGVW